MPNAARLPALPQAEHGMELHYGYRLKQVAAARDKPQAMF